MQSPGTVTVMRIHLSGTAVSVEFDPNDQRDILNVARQRAVIGAEFRDRLHLYVDGDAASLNRVGNHISGEMTERAVEFWLKAQGVTAVRPNDLRQEITEGMPDIGAGAVRIDVKSTVFLPDVKFPVQQVKVADDTAIVWCKPDRSGGMTAAEYDTKVPLIAELFGWATMAEVAHAEVSGDEHYLARKTLRPLTDLLTWISSGVCPPHPTRSPR